MPILRVNQQPGTAPNLYRIEVSASEILGFQPPSFSGEIEFAVSPQDGERIRWYLEDYLQFDEDPAPQIAKQVEAFMAERGEALFRSIFDGSHQGKQLWALVEPHLSSTRIEVTTGIAEATAIPWELIRNPHTRTSLALSAQAFVRTQQAAQLALSPQAEAEKVRILLVICRPRGGEDVPFRSVAGRLVTRLSEGDREAFQLDVLRPPTYEQLAATLDLAKEQGRPYHIVHFDGHGIYADPKKLEGVGKVLSSLMLKSDGTGAHGFLMFEDPDSETNGEFVDGFRVGTLLKDSGVPFLIPNACQSAFAEAPAEPNEKTPGETRNEIEAYGSLAQAVMEAGAAGVVAMRYSVYVVTAAQFVAELYGALARGRRLGEAVTWARKNLANQPERRIAYEARPLQDWCVPVVWERAPLRLWPEKPNAASIKIKLDDDAAAKPGALDQALPARPDVGFYGRDETLYALDRAFDTHRIVLMHAYAGSGKTAAAAEFARWYALTGGIAGPVLFTSFERHLPLARVLDKIGRVFGQIMEGAGIHWDATTDSSKRREITLQILRQMPVLWIWDNVEPITGFPAGTKSEWSIEEQQELRTFLSAARDTKAKFLLTSRRDEGAWLSELPRRVRVPPMPMRERLQLASAIVEHRGKRLADLPDFQPLLRFTHGNPLTILVAVGEALRAGIDTKDHLDMYVEALRDGERSFEDEETEGRSKSLDASLSYGFGHAFSDDERKILALLHLFQGVVNVDVLRAMGSPDAEWCLEAVRGLTRERGIALLDRAAELGLLESHGGGYYGIHPAVPWYFRDLFEQGYPAEAGNAAASRRAFVKCMGEFGNYYCNQYVDGHREVLSIVSVEEDNLLAAWRLAREHGWWSSVIETMQGLRSLYQETGREGAWRRLVENAASDFIDPETEGPLPGLEIEWRVLTEYRARLARSERDLARGEHLQRMITEWSRKRARSALETTPELWDERQRHDVRTLAVAVHELARFQLEKGDPLCADAYREALDLAIAIGDTAAQEICVFSLAKAHHLITDLRNLDEAERWYQRSLEMCALSDDVGRGRTLGQLGLIARERFDEALAAKRSPEEAAPHLVKAIQFYEQALEMFPKTAVTDRGIAHHQLGVNYRVAGNVERALYHYRQDIRYCEEAGDTYGAGHGRRSAALALLHAGRLDDARAYAEAALANFNFFGERAAEDVEGAQQLMTLIDQAIAKKGGSS
jgi:tetratricopeptide (TPR) repeat protein